MDCELLGSPLEKQNIASLWTRRERNLEDSVVPRPHPILEPLFLCCLFLSRWLL